MITCRQPPCVLADPTLYTSFRSLLFFPSWLPLCLVKLWIFSELHQIFPLQGCQITLSTIWCFPLCITSFSSSSNISSNVMNGLFTLWLLDYAYGKPSNVPSTMSMLPSPEPVSVFSSMGQRTFPQWLRILRWQPSPELPRWVQYNLKQWTPVFFGSRDWFHGRLFFHRSGSGGWFGADSNTLHLLC